MYTYSAEIVRVIDGDTVDLNIDLGFHIKMLRRARLLMINAPEKNTDLGRISKEFLSKTLPEGSLVTIKTQLDKNDKYGRVLVEIFVPDEILSVNKIMLDAGHAEHYK
jgi:micrococcal nuclease